MAMAARTTCSSQNQGFETMSATTVMKVGKEMRGQGRSPRSMSS